MDCAHLTDNCAFVFAVVIFLPVAFGITVLMNQSATSPMHGFGILQVIMLGTTLETNGAPRNLQSCLC